MHVILDHVEDTAASIKTFWFRSEEQVSYVAGQFTELYLPHRHADERGEKHWFTLSSSPTEPLLAITTKFTSDRSSTFKRLLRSTTPGTALYLADPMGDFVLPKDKTIPLVFAASGIGITPVRSIVKYLSDIHELRDIRLLYAARREDELAFTEIFDTYPLTFTPIVGHPTATWPGQIGRIDARQILEAANSSNRSLIYLSGPESMVEELNNTLQESGVAKHRIITDFFHGYS
jgi:ferredoxin-NADP reductase